MCYAQSYATMTAAAGLWLGVRHAAGCPDLVRCCIIRLAMLNDMAEALAKDSGRNRMLAPSFQSHLPRSGPALRT